MSKPTVSYWKRSIPQPEPKHLCADLTFSKKVKVDDSPIICECGWSGTVGEWSLHAPRLAVSRAWSEPTPTVKREPDVCSSADCDRVAIVSGYCKPHWSRQHRGASMDGPIRPPRNPNGPYGYAGRP